MHMLYDAASLSFVDLYLKTLANGSPQGPGHTAHIVDAFISGRGGSLGRSLGPKRDDEKEDKEGFFNVFSYLCCFVGYRHPDVVGSSILKSGSKIGPNHDRHGVQSRSLVLCKVGVLVFVCLCREMCELML